MSDTFFDQISVTRIGRETATGTYRIWGKRLVDVALVLLIVPMAVLIVALAWALTRLDGGRGLYRQARVGRAGRVFWCWKIRTMVPDADRVLAQMILADPKIAAEWRTTQKLLNDPRVTRLGNLLRKASIDELPQLWNVLRGDMSLIGPRPFTPAQRPLYDALPDGGAYYELRPGISGLWQVDCRNTGRFEDRVAYDETYNDQLALVSDLRIALRTVAVVLRGTGN